MEQSASFPGSDPLSRTDFLRARSRAFLAASRACAEESAFPAILFATDGVSSKNSWSPSPTMEATSPLTSLFPSLVFVCPSN